VIGPGGHLPALRVAGAPAGALARHHAAPMRRLYLLLIAAAVLVFVVVSALLARVWSAESAERSAITQLVSDEARGDQAATLRRIEGCAASSTCRAGVAADVAALKHGGSVSILQLLPSSGFSIGETRGIARVAWNVGGSLPIVQCVSVRRTGNVLSGLHVQLLAVTGRLQNSDSTCPSRV
jgi:hypothetical protein